MDLAKKYYKKEWAMADEVVNIALLQNPQAAILCCLRQVCTASLVLASALHSHLPSSDAYSYSNQGLRYMRESASVDAASFVHWLPGLQLQEYKIK
jgi:hypothetical protein